MALDSTKWQIQLDKSIRYTGGDHGTATANYVTVLEFHRWLQDLADEGAISADDFMDITTVNPSDKKFETIIELKNNYNLDDAHTTPASEFIYKGSIIQDSGSGETIYDGMKIVATRGVVVNVIQDNAVLTNKYWNSTPDGETFAGINADPANGVAMQFMVQVKLDGSDIDNNTLLFTTREWGKTFSEFRIPSTGRGENTVPLAYADDLNNASSLATADDSTGFGTHVSNDSAGYNVIDLNQGDGDKGYYSAYNFDTANIDINDFYENMKYKTRNGESTIQVYGMDGELFRGVTHKIETGVESGGSWVEGGATPVSWGTGATAGTGQILADDDTNDTIYIQLLTGVVPTDSMLLTQGAVSATTIASNSVTDQTVATPFCGASTGSSIVGAFGFGIVYADLATADKLVSLDDGVTRNPPNNVTFTVKGIQNLYRVLVGPEDGASGLDYDQLSLSTTYNTAGITSIVMTEDRPANTPDSGTIRIQRNDGSYTRHPYSAITSDSPLTFTITSEDFDTNSADSADNAFISYIDAASSGTSISFNTVQTSVQTLFVEARYAGTGPDYTDSIKPAASTGSLTASGGTATLSPVSDA